MGYFEECAEWMEGFLVNQIVIRSSVAPDRKAMQINLLSLSKENKLLCFTYSSNHYPAPQVFDLTPFHGENLTEQIHSLMSAWYRLGLTFWTATSQASACELWRTKMNIVVNPESLEMLMAYHRLLACLETHPNITGTISDVVTAHKRLKGFLDEKTAQVMRSLESLKSL